MANTITTQVLDNGPRNLALNIFITGDGTGEETNTLLVDASAYGATDLVLSRVWANLSGFTLDLIWDATANVPFLHIADYDISYLPHLIDGITNNAGSGKTGDVLFSTTGLGSGDKGSLILHFKKKYA